MRVKKWIIFVLLILVPTISFSAEKLIFTLDLIRHGDRTPIRVIPAIPYKWKIGLGQLTAEGMRQEYELGKQFRKHYIDETHLLPANYQQESMYVFSTDVERTLMSAESVLMGLYPPGTGPVTDKSQAGLPQAYQPIPIHTAPKKYDHMIIHRIDSAAEKMLMEKYVYSTAEWQRKEHKLKPYFQRWSALTGLQITKLKHLQSLSDSLFVHQTHHVPTPAGMNDDEIKTIIEAGMWAFIAEKKPKPVANAYSSQVMANIAKFMKTSSEQKSRLRFVLLSAHDSTIASALSFIGGPLTTPPRYASDLNFSLYESGTKNYIVKVSYNGTPIMIPACGHTSCTLQKFLEIAEDNK